MKKMIIRVSVLALVLVLTAGMFGINAFADENAAQYVYDPAYLLTDEEYVELNAIAAQISDRYQCAVHFVTNDDPELNMDNIQLYSEDLYLASPALGYGENKDGFMLVLGVQDRCYWLMAYGPYGNYALTDYGKDWMSENFLEYFAENQWYEGFRTYLMDCDYVLSCAAEGKPVDIYYSEEDIGTEGFGIAGIIGALASFIICGVLKGKMKNVHKATGAAQYLDAGNVEILYRYDRFMHTDVSRVKRKTDDESGSRGGTTVNSRGFSGKGGRF